MIKHRIEDLQPDHAHSLRDGYSETTIRWAVSRESAGAELGSVAWIEVAAGGRYPVERYPDCERIVYVASGAGVHHGDGEARQLSEGDGVLVPKGGWHGFENTSAEPVLLVALFAPYADVSEARCEQWVAGSDPGPNVVRVSASEIDYDPDLRDDMGFIGLDVKWLVDAETAGAEHMLFGLSRFAPSGSHILHRHPQVEEVIYVVDGAGDQLVAGQPSVPIRTGDLTYASAGEWHGHQASVDREMHFMFLYLGRSSLADAGYELHADVIAADA